MFIIQWTLFISSLHELRSRGCLSETECVIYDFIAEMTFRWNQYEFLKSVRVSKRIISQIYVRNTNKNFRKRVFCNYL